MAGLSDLQPRYLVVGRTHPKVAHRDGEAYRDGLVRRARSAGVADIVELDDRYLDAGALGGRETTIGERVLWPQSPSESRGIEDARFVHIEDEGVYRATRALDGLVRPGEWTGLGSVTAPLDHRRRSAGSDRDCLRRRTSRAN